MEAADTLADSDYHDASLDTLADSDSHDASLAPTTTILRSVAIAQPFHPLLTKFYGIRREDLPFHAEENILYDIAINAAGRISSIDVAVPIDDAPVKVNEKFFGAGFVVFPGLIDSMIRPFTLSADEEGSALLALAHGVTAVRAVGSNTSTASMSINHISPRVFYTGRELDGVSPARIGAQVCIDANAAQFAADARVQEGACAIALGPNLTVEARAAAIQVATIAGLSTVGQGSSVIDTLYLSDARQGIPWGGSPGMFETWLKAMAEGGGVMEGGQSGLMIATPALTPLFHLAHESGVADANSGKIPLPSSLDFAPCNCAVDILVSPCPGLGGGAGGLRNHCCSMRYARAILPTHITQVAWGALSPGSKRVQPLLPFGRSITDGARSAAPAAFNAAFNTISRLTLSGTVAIHAGSDAGSLNVCPGAGLHTELFLLSAAGLGDDFALASATVLPACSLSTLPRFAASGGGSKLAYLGFVVPGALADLVIARADPRFDLKGALSSIVATVTAGRVYTAEDLDERIRAYASLSDESLAAKALPIVAPLLRKIMSWWG